MKARAPQTVIKPDYRQFRLRKHIKLPLFWPVFGLTFLALCISLSTVFMKQHSILDVLCALSVCALGWRLCYGRPGRHG